MTMYKKILDLPLKAKWYEMQECGEKQRSIERLPPIGLNAYALVLMDVLMGIGPRNTTNVYYLAGL